MSCGNISKGMLPDHILTKTQFKLKSIYYSLVLTCINFIAPIIFYCRCCYVPALQSGWLRHREVKLLSRVTQLVNDWAQTEAWWAFGLQSPHLQPLCIWPSFKQSPCPPALQLKNPRELFNHSCTTEIRIFRHICCLHCCFPVRTKS